MADPFPRQPTRTPTIRPDSARFAADHAALARAVDELQAASRHFTKAVELLAMAMGERDVRAAVRPYPGGLPLRDRPARYVAVEGILTPAIAAEIAATLRPGESR